MSENKETVCGDELLTPGGRRLRCHLQPHGPDVDHTDGVRTWRDADPPPPYNPTIRNKDRAKMR